MTLFVFAAVCSYSIAGASIISLSRFGKVLKTYRPFIYFTCFALLNEVCSTYLLWNRFSNSINGNIYVLINFFLILWQFKNWGAEHRQLKEYQLTGFILLLVWLFDNLVINDINRTNFLFRLCSSVVLVYLSVEQISYVCIIQRGKFLSNARFLISSSLTVFFTFKAITELLFLVQMEMTVSFYQYLFLIFIIINLICNCFFAIAALCLPTKYRFTI